MTQASPTGIIIGVDTHKHTHTAVAITGLGTRVSVLHGCAGWRKGRPVSMLRISLRANDDETQAPRKFRLEGVGELSRGHAQ